MTRVRDWPSPVVDCHAHHIPADVIALLRDGTFPGISVTEADGALTFAFPGLAPSPPAPARISDLPEFVRWQDENGIDVQVLSPWTDLFGYTLAEDKAGAWVASLNDAMVSATSASGRFATLAAIPLPYPNAAVAEIRRARATGHCGTIIGTSAPGMELDDRRLDPVWAELTALGMPVQIHPTFLARNPRWQAYGLANAVGRAQETTTALSRMLLGGVLARHPGLCVVACHGGGALPFLLGRLQRAHELQPQATISPLEDFRRLYLDSVVLDPRVLTSLLMFTTADRILLGSDYPFPWEPHPAAFLASALPDGAAAAGIPGGNACAVFGLAARGTAAAGSGAR